MIRETYTYLWSVLIKARNENIDVKRVKFITSKKVSPYLELNVEQINFKELEMEDGNYIIEVNPYIRLTPTFKYLYDINYQKALKFKKSLGNIFFHLMGSFDLFDGKSSKDFHVEFVIEDIEKAQFGEKAKVSFQSFNSHEKFKIAEVLYDLYSFENRMEAYKRAVKKIFNASIIYDNNFSKDELIIYINSEENEDNIRKMECINILFLPLWLKTRIFWEHHFGIIGLPVTTKIGKTAIY